MTEVRADQDAPQGGSGSAKILLLAALPLEVQHFLRLSRARRRRGLRWPAWEFLLGGERGVLALSGMGARAAREAAACLVGQFQPHLLVSLGFGGAVTPELPTGSLVLGEFFYSFDPTTQVLDSIPRLAGPRPLADLLRSLAAAGLEAFPGSLITTPYIINKAEQAGPLRSLTCPVLDLESAAVAAVARAEGLPCLGLRAITDTAAEEIPDFLPPGGEEPGAVGLWNVLGWLAANPRRLKDLVHLWRCSRLAAARLAKALTVLLPLLLSEKIAT
ncbi:MAG: hypothetical protein M1438_05235 [Deltaproteobacteria bacterium]|nr:hypothetical protein [Deltaproteobacteria bacterium]